LNAIGALGPKAAPFKDKIKDWTGRPTATPPRLGGYVERVLADLSREISG
jgi:hypothetical protein